MNAPSFPARRGLSRRLLAGILAIVVGLAVVGIALVLLLGGPRAAFATPIRRDPGNFEIDVASASPNALLSSWAVRVLEQGVEVIPQTNLLPLSLSGVVGFQPHIDFLDDRAYEAGAGDGRLDPGDAFFVGNLAVGFTYTIELIWVESGATVARAEFVEPG